MEPLPVEISGESIRLGQLLKLASLAESGSEVKLMLAEGAVEVNGQPETRRGRQLAHGDVVDCAVTTGPQGRQRIVVESSPFRSGRCPGGNG